MHMIIIMSLIERVIFLKVIIIGGGWAGCAAAITAKQAGAQVSIYERTDLLLGLGNVGGLMRNNGRYTAAEELINLGAGDLIHITDNNVTHKNMNFPSHQHAWPYNVNNVEPEVKKHLLNLGIDINTLSRVTKIKKNENKILSIKLENGNFIDGDVFIDATGSTGGMNNCYKYGNGCVMCILRCPTFGGRVSISSLAGVKDILSERDDGSFGAFSGSCEISRESISEDILNKLDKDGVAVLKIPEEDVNLEKLKLKVCQQYALEEFAENLVLLDTGHIKLMTPFYPIDKLRKIKGLEKARFSDPYSGGKGNSIRYLAAAPRTNDLKVIGVDNLFCAGEKAGFFIGHTEAMCTGSLAGHNAVRYLANLEPLILPDSTAIGDIISYSNYRTNNTPDGKKIKFTFSGAEYFNRMKKLKLYSIDNKEIKDRVEQLGLTGIYIKKLI